jgi:hypothetical protein
MPTAASHVSVARLKHFPSGVRSLTKNTCTLAQSTPSTPASPASALAYAAGSTHVISVYAYFSVYAYTHSVYACTSLEDDRGRSRHVRSCCGGSCFELLRKRCMNGELSCVCVCEARRQQPRHREGTT